MMFGAYPKATRPIAALPRRQGTVQAFAVFAASGVGALAATGISIVSASAAFAGVGNQSFALIGQARATAAFAGAGSQSFTLRGNANAVLTAAGLGAFQASSIVSAYMALSAAGLGAFQGALSSTASATLSATGVGAFAPVLTAQVFADANFAGSGAFNGADSPASEASFTGLGTFSAVGYAFYLDAEVAAPREEIRVVYVPWAERNPIEDVAIVASEIREAYAASENTVAVVPPENRVYYTQRKPRVPAPPNRRRKP